MIFLFSATKENNMINVAAMPPRVNGILETSLYVESPARSAEFYRRVFGFEPLEPGDPRTMRRVFAQCVRVIAACCCSSRKALLLIRTPSAQFTSHSGSLVVICLLGNAG